MNRTVSKWLTIFSQILTQLEGFVKQDYLSSNFETTKELLRHYASSRALACQSVLSESVSQLPWIPLTTAAVALRLFEFDASVSYDGEPRAERCNGLKVESFTVEFSPPL